MVEYVSKFILGGLIIVFVSYLSKQGDSVFAGIIAIAPIITLISFFIVGNESGSETLKNVVYSSIVYLPLTLIYLFSIYLLLRNTGIHSNLILIISFIAWLICAYGLMNIEN